MPIASWTDDAAKLTWLVLGVLAFVALLVVIAVFHKEIKNSLMRMSNFRIRRKGTEIGADLEKPGHSPDDREQSPESVDREGVPDALRRDPVAHRPSIARDPTSLRDAMVESYQDGEEGEGDRLFEQLKALEPNQIQKKRDEIRRHGGRYMGGIDQEGLKALDGFTSDEEVSSFAHQMIGRCLRHVGKNVEAGDEFKKAAEKAGTALERAEATVERGVSLADSGQHDLAARELGAFLAEDADAEIQARIWMGLARIYKRDDSKVLGAIALHQAAVHTGNDAQKWFDAGYAYTLGSSGMALPALHCYITALKLDSSLKYATNNVGVLLREMDLPIHAVTHFRESADAGDTLSMSNIAERYLDAGFASDATGLLRQATADSEPHKRVASVTADLEARRDDEQQKFSKLKNEGGRAAEFMVEHAAARWYPAADVAEKWTWGADAATVTVTDKGIEILWKVQPPLPYRRFVGSIEGTAMLGRFEKEAQVLGSASTVWEADGLGYAIVDESGQAARFMKIDTDTVQYLELSRMEEE